jgi:hypothetical protein
MSRYPTTESEFQQWDEENAAEDVRRCASRARTEDEYLEALREAGSLGAGLAVMSRGAGPAGTLQTPTIAPFAPEASTTEELECYESMPCDPAIRERYLADPIVSAALAELAERRQERKTA